MKKEDTVKLISAEGFEFVVDKKAAMVSQTIRNMLTSPGLSLSPPQIRVFQFFRLVPEKIPWGFSEAQHGEVTFPEISTTILEKIWIVESNFVVQGTKVLKIAVSTFSMAQQNWVFRSSFYVIVCNGNNVRKGTDVAKLHA
ncbi:hypothetical protein TEA_024069 [Camellia sinensis var. sinensis]|uniref:SKP1 component POZ domain-containing protein n=1 Tax=Camellia sinensis var. sinensis TaxID=542762 RepID=A0A4S4EBN6_CAMSN|nr:hypothetical protein TEA_024069 [Camellia sinensis var. sinensis]